MFEKFLKKERKLIPNFIENPEMEALIKEYYRTLRDRYGYTVDGSKEQVQEARERVKKIEDEFGQQMREYLKPYMDNKIEHQNISLSEHDRWKIAEVLRKQDEKLNDQK